ncbi:glycosyl transferase, WecB/TagA/CpsF family [Thermanaerovibrio acidaminovorans DSM 6589]|uniref:Glycosyl transferase, WecB/TagA/CpsF family n=1 Tax=Thermanaerovibrio acidaminovorans (strain ATCC 49978 / DSM 6589 / Su883) TaxID=525903 RepID=D1B5E6_THEAS|nr:WecB/TagA/CpsF family glycosyltransferase [Thermanaerovibrio acidaminovorans]ACZ19237.1 glycosyl transferase, WecB/TagA/CpsF family [Thermanaerovibrio acidaminovorans DSM 6589]
MSGQDAFWSLLLIAAVGMVGVLIQRFFKGHLARDQYYYVKDIVVLGSWAMMGLWSGNGLLKWVIVAAMGGFFLGFCQKVQRSFDLRPLFLLLGLALALWGPRIGFLGMPGDVFLFLPEGVAVLLSAMWYSLFPLIFQEVDQIPGLGGQLLLVGWGMMTLGVLTASSGWNEVTYASLGGLVIIVAFWSRYLHVYGRLGEHMAALWGVLFGGLSVLGVSKGLAFSVLFMAPVGLFLVPLAETSLRITGAVLMRRELGNVTLYRALMNRGMDHPKAVYLVTTVCLAFGMMGFSAQRSASYLQLGVLMSSGIMLVFTCFLVFFQGGEGVRHQRRPRIFDVFVDNVSLNYVLGRIRAMVAGGENCLICTLDALGALRSREDGTYRKALNRADFVLPDGKGLMEGLRFLGTPIVERLPGVEFVDHLSRLAAAEGWGVYLLGGLPGVAEEAARKLSARHRGLNVVGARDGYFSKEEEPSVVEAIKSSGARVLVVGLGVPRQEIWLEDLLKGDAPPLRGVVGIGVGGSLDVISGRLKRAPKGWQRMGLEWLYRVIQEPWRIRRVMRLPLFVLLVMAERFGRRREG